MDILLTSIVSLVKVACTSGPFFEKNYEAVSIFSLQINYYQNHQRHK